MVNKWLKRVSFLALLVGAIFAIEENFQTLRLKDVAIPSLVVLSDSVLWPRIQPRDVRLWPLFCIDKGKVVRKIERNVPVRVFIKCTGWGHFLFNAHPLKPKFMVFWEGSKWFITEDGLMWPANHPMNRIIAIQKPEESPIVIWSVKDNTKYRIAPDEIINSPIPLSKLEYWKRLLEDNDLYNNVKRFSVFTEGNSIYLEIFMQLGNQKVKVKLPASGRNWHMLLKAVKNILKDPEIRGSDVFIDTTYEGKILVRKEDKSAGVQ